MHKVMHPWCSHSFGTTLCSLLGSVSTQDGTQEIQAKLARAEEMIKAHEVLSSNLQEACQRTVRYAQSNHSSLRNVRRIFHFEDEPRKHDSKGNTRPDKQIKTRDLWRQNVKTRSPNLHEILEEVIEPVNVAVREFSKKEPAMSENLFVYRSSMPL